MKLKIGLFISILFAVISLAGNAFANFSFDFSTDYAAGDTQADFTLSFTSTETVTFDNYMMDFTFDTSELTFLTLTQNNIGLLNNFLAGGYKVNEDAGFISNVSGYGSTGPTISAGSTIDLVTFSFAVDTAIADGETDFNFDYSNRALQFAINGVVYNNGGALEAIPNMTDIAPAPVPVPAAIWLLGSGIAGLACFRRKQA